MAIGSQKEVLQLMSIFSSLRCHVSQRNTGIVFRGSTQSGGESEILEQTVLYLKVRLLSLLLQRHFQRTIGDNNITRSKVCRSKR